MRKTTECFKREVFNLVGDEYIVLTEYSGSKNPITLFHTVCGLEWETIPNRFLSGARCLNCSHRRPVTLENIIKITSEKLGEDYRVTCVNGTNDITLVHEACGVEFKTTKSSINNKKRCNSCYGNTKKTQAQYCAEVQKAIGSSYIIVSEYKGVNKPILIKHSECGRTYETIAKTPLRGFGCSLCSRNLKKTTETFSNEIHKLTDGKYKVLGEYISANSKVLIKHIECDTNFQVKPNNFLNGTRCPVCSKTTSKGELLISEFLDNQGINYTREYKFSDCKNTNPLPFDFFLGETNTAIEFDGIQHFEPVEVFGGEKGLRKTQENDKIKDKYCTENNITLIRIPYTEINNIQSILKEHIKGAN